MSISNIINQVVSSPNPDMIASKVKIKDPNDYMK